MTTVSIRKAAELCPQYGLGEVSHVAILNAIKRGEAAKESDGRIDMEKLRVSEWGRRRIEQSGGAIAPSVADPAEDRDPRAVDLPPAPSPSNQLAVVAPRPSSLSVAPPLLAAQLESAAPDSEEVTAPADPADMASVLVRSKLDIEKLKVAEQWRRQKLDNDEREKKLVRAEEVESATEARFRAEAQALLNWPARTHAEMAAELGVDARLLLVTLERYVEKFMQERSSVDCAAGVAA